MGMFDYLKCEYPPPLPGRQREVLGRDWCEHDFRAKDFDCRVAWELRSRLQRERRERFPATWVGRRLYPAYAWMVHTFRLLINRGCRVVANQSERATRNVDRLVRRLAPFGDPIRAKQHQRRMAGLSDAKD